MINFDLKPIFYLAFFGLAVLALLVFIGVPSLVYYLITHLQWVS